MISTPFPLPIMLDAADRKALRARAHHLDPVVMIGEAGLTRAVLDETDRALRAHELIKVRVLGDDRAQRQALSTEICSALGCTAVQAIGKLLVLYRPRPIEDNATTHVPKKRAAQGAASPAKKGATARRVAAPRKVSGARKAAAPRKVAGAKKAAPRTRTGVGSMTAMKTRKADPQADAAPSPRSPRARAASHAPGEKALATEGKRTALAARKRAPARRGASSASTQGPSRLQGQESASPRGRRDRAKKA